MAIWAPLAAGLVGSGAILKFIKSRNDTKAQQTILDEVRSQAPQALIDLSKNVISR